MFGKRKPRPADDRVTPELHAEVIQRDKRCIGAKRDDRHRCADQYGNEHASDDRDRLTVDHVWWEPGGAKGKRAPSSREHLVAMCGRLNNGPPDRDTREAERALLFNHYPGHGQWHGPCAHTRQ